jgi:folate-binding protein YgfZ
MLRVALDDWLLLTSVEDAVRLVESLTRFKIRVDVDLSDESAEIGRVAVMGAPAADAVSEVLGIPVPPEPNAHRGAGGDGLRVVRGDWPDMPRVEIVGSGEALEATRAELLARGAEALAPELVEVLRIEAGVPSPGNELDASTIAQEAFLERDAVSFTKGCFLGQELVCRIDTRGHVNRFLRGLRPAAEVEAGQSLQRDGRDVGTITSAATSPRLGPIALAYVRREVEPGATLDVAASAPVPAEVVELPFPADP